MNVKNFLIQTLITGLAVLIGAYLLSGIHVSGYGSALLVALALALLNQLIKPLLVVLTIPATILTLGLFLLVINAVVILLADWMVLGFQVDGFWWALFFSFILSITKSFLNIIFGQDVNKNRINDKE